MRQRERGREREIKTGKHNTQSNISSSFHAFLPGAHRTVRPTCKYVCRLFQFLFSRQNWMTNNAKTVKRISRDTIENS